MSYICSPSDGGDPSQDTSCSARRPIQHPSCMAMSPPLLVTFDSDPRPCLHALRAKEPPPGACLAMSWGRCCRAVPHVPPALDTPVKNVQPWAEWRATRLQLLVPLPSPLLHPILAKPLPCRLTRPHQLPLQQPCRSSMLPHTQHVRRHGARPQALHILFLSPLPRQQCPPPTHPLGPLTAAQPPLQPGCCCQGALTSDGAAG
jgi:hypothetical protein